MKLDAPLGHPDNENLLFAFAAIGCFGFMLALQTATTFVIARVFLAGLIADSWERATVAAVCSLLCWTVAYKTGRAINFMGWWR